MPRDLLPVVLLLLREDGLAVALLARGKPLLAHEQDVDKALQVDQKCEASLDEKDHFVLLEEVYHGAIGKEEDVADEDERDDLVTDGTRLVLPHEEEACDRDYDHDCSQEDAVPLVIGVGNELALIICVAQ